MNKQIVMGLLRHGLTTIGGMVAAAGYMELEPDSVEQIVGVVMAIAGITWSVLDKNSTTASQVEYIAPTVPQVVVVPDEVISTKEFHKRAEPKKYDVNEPNGFLLSGRSRKNLEGVNPKLVSVVKTAIELTDVDFAVTEGVRSAERQAELVAEGKSWVKKSKHQSGDAIDVAAFPNNYPGDVSWEAKHYAEINKAFQEAAKIHNCRVTWGGNWIQRDGVHFQFESEIV